MAKRYIKLGNGATFVLDRVACIVRKDINQYVILLDETPVTINADLNDVEAIEAQLDLIRVEKKEEVLKTRLETDD